MTDNPIVIMLINMTIVFAVLAILNVFLRIIHMVDPTFKKEEPAKVQKATVPAPAPVVAPEPVVEEGISPEVVAAIAGALAAYGVGFSQIKAIRPINRSSWANAGRLANLNNNL